jgi:hypothetical protein
LGPPLHAVSALRVCDGIRDATEMLNPGTRITNRK